MTAARPLTLIGMAHPPTSRYAAGWWHPGARSDWLSKEYWIETAQLMERGGFDVMFVPDALAVPEDGDGSVATTLEVGGMGAINLDPMISIATAIGATSTLGLCATVSTTFVPPYFLARQLLSIDHLSGGRCAWNIVTSHGDAEARNLGLERMPDRQARYDQADEVVAAMLDLMQTWEEGALLLDTATPRFADPAKVRRTAVGAAPGPMSLPRSPQGHPVLMQAGSSERGMDFAARWAEIVFCGADGLEATRALRDELRARAERLGRDPDGIRVCSTLQVVTGATALEAQAKLQGLIDAIDEPLALRALQRLMQAPDAAMVPEASAVEFLDAHAGATGSAGFEQMMRDACERQGLTVRGLAEQQALNQLSPQIIGSGEEVAAELARWQDEGAVDGFVLQPAVHNESLEDFVEHVCPELARLGRLRGARAPMTLRDRLALPAADAAPNAAR